jgi:hypothetical protein
MPGIMPKGFGGNVGARYVGWKSSTVAAHPPAVSAFPDEPGCGFGAERDVAAEQP